MSIHDWKYFDHAVMPTTPPHITPDLTPVEDGLVWKAYKNALMVRYTTEWDCSVETDWWYLIKDTVFDISSLKAKRRYEITKGLKNFYVKRIEPREFAEELCDVEIAAFSAYPAKYRPRVDRREFVDRIKRGWKNAIVYGAFSQESDKLCGYSVVNPMGDKCFAFSIQRTMPEYESRGVNAALVAVMLEDNQDFLQDGRYICDGARSIVHETAFQNYLEKYFGFRKAYCRLHLVYRPVVSWVVKWLYPFRKLLKKGGKIRFINRVYSVLKMEEIRRSCEKEL